MGFVEWVKRVLKLEPVVVQSVIRAAFVLAAAIGLNVSDEVQGKVLVAVVLFYALVEAVTTLLARARAVPVAKVVEVAEPDGNVYAGPASEIPTGTLIRDAGTPDSIVEWHPGE